MLWCSLSCCVCGLIVCSMCCCVGLLISISVSDGLGCWCNVVFSVNCGSNR